MISRWMPPRVAKSCALSFALACGCSNEYADFTVSPQDGGIGEAASATTAATGGAGAQGGAAASTASSGTTTTGAAGSGGSAGCGPGSTATLDDDFDSAALDSAAWGVYESASHVSQTGGAVVVTLADNQDNGQYAGVYSNKADYDLRECHVLVHVLEVPASASSADAYLVVKHLGDKLAMTAYWGKLALGLESSPSLGLEIPYDATAHTWWKIRESQGTTYFEASPDGVMWTEVHQLPSPSWVSGVEIQLGGGAWEATPGPGLARFDDLNLPP